MTQEERLFNLIANARERFSAIEMHQANLDINARTRMAIRITLIVGDLAEALSVLSQIGPTLLDGEE